MTRNQPSFRYFLSLVLLSSALLFGACSTEDGDSDTSADSEFAEAIPDPSMLSLTIGEGDAQTSEQGLRVAESPLIGDPSAFGQGAQKVVDRVNAAVEKTHQRLEQLREGAEPVSVQQGDRACQMWEVDGEKNHWRLTSCRATDDAKRYSFALLGRPLESTSDDDYLAVAGGVGSVLPRHEGKRRGAGKMGYDLDNLNALLGEGPKGKVSFGYRADGPRRQLVVGLKQFQGEGDDTPRDALYSFQRVRGTGGLLRFVQHTDFLGRDADGNLEQGSDGVVEVGRASLAWRSDGRARTTAVACGGTAGEGACVRVQQCWDADLGTTFEAIDSDPNARIEWEATSCPSDAELPVADGEPPTEGETTPPGSGSDDVPGPDIDAPAENGNTSPGPDNGDAPGPDGATPGG